MPGNYLIQHSAGSIIRGAFQIYFRHFSTLFLIFVLPMVPVAVFQTEAQLSENVGLFMFSLLLALIVGTFAYGAITMAVSDICLGNPPSFRRSYAKVLGKRALLLLGTSLLQT